MWPLVGIVGMLVFFVVFLALEWIAMRPPKVARRKAPTQLGSQIESPPSRASGAA
jgi:hypothetical protein